MDLRRYFFELTPLGRADNEVRKHIGEGFDNRKFKKYENALNHYRTVKTAQISVRTLLYASIITSVVTTFGFEQVRLLQQAASYLGATILLIAYAVTSYFSLMARELYQVQREILLSSIIEK